MAILQGDLKILKSEIFTDNINGGGSATKQEVLSGTSNNMFQDVSTIDRVTGRVNIRGIYPSIESAANETGLGCHTILSKLAGDTKQEMFLMEGEFHNRLPQMVDTLESFINQGARTQLFVYGTAFANSSLVNLIAHPKTAIPEIGDVLQLVNSVNNNFLSIADISAVLTTITTGDGETQRNVITITTRQPLQHTFTGVSNVVTFDGSGVLTRIFEGAVVNSAKYYSAKPTTSPTVVNDNNVSVESVFGQIVPASRVDVPIVNQSITDNEEKIATASTVSHSRTFSFSTTYTLGYAITPGSLTVSGFSVLGNSIQLSNVEVATVDYSTGTFTKSGTPGTLNFTCQLLVGAVEGDSAESFAHEVTVNNRSTVYTFILPNFVTVGSMVVRYRVLNKWVTMRDDGAGSFTGVGSGNIFYETKTLSLSLAALPDVGSAIVISYANRVGITALEADAFSPKLHFVKIFNNTSFDPSSLTITYTSSGNVTRTITCNSAGVLGGDGTGLYERETGVVAAVPSFDPISTADVIYSYSSRTEVTETISSLTLNGAGVATVTLSTTPIIAGSLKLTYDLLVSADSFEPVNAPAPIGNGVLVSNGRTANATNLNAALVRKQIVYGLGIGDPKRSYKPPAGFGAGLGLGDRGLSIKQ